MLGRLWLAWRWRAGMRAASVSHGGRARPRRATEDQQQASERACQAGLDQCVRVTSCGRGACCLLHGLAPSPMKLAAHGQLGPLFATLSKLHRRRPLGPTTEARSAGQAHMRATRMHLAGRLTAGLLLATCWPLSGGHTRVETLRRLLSAGQTACSLLPLVLPLG